MWDEKHADFLRVQSAECRVQSLECGVFLQPQASSLRSQVSRNSVFVSSGTVRGKIFGGHLDSGNGNATNNTVTLSGNPNLAASNIYGGYSASSTPGDLFTGNTLNVHNGGHVVKSLQNFEYMNFFVPSTMGNGGVMVTATESANITNVIARNPRTLNFRDEENNTLLHVALASLSKNFGFVEFLVQDAFFTLQYRHVHQTMLQEIERQKTRVLGVGGVVSHRQPAATIQK